MPEFTLHHVDQISRDISRQEIVFSHLLHDLVDHVCCDVENEMQSGLSFSDAYRKVKEKMGSRRLKEIQEETLYAVDTKYRYMKTMMKISGVAGTILLGTAALFKIQHWPGAGIMMSLGALILAFMFLPSALGVLWKETHNSKRVFLFVSAFLTGMFFILGAIFKIQHWPAAGIILSLSVLSGIVFFIPALLINRINDTESKDKRTIYIIGAVGLICYITGLLFKIQHWPLSGVLMVAGVILLGVIVFPWYTWVTYKSESNIKASFIFILIGSLTIIIPGVLINLNLQESFDFGNFSHMNQQQILNKCLYTNNISLITSYNDSVSHPQMEKLNFKTKEVLTLIGNIQAKMVQESEGEPGIPAVSAEQIRQTERGPEILPRLLNKPFHTGPVRDFLLPGCSARLELNNALTVYKEFITDLAPEEDARNYSTLLDPTKYLPGEISGDKSVSLLTGLHSLEVLENSILTVESNMLNILASKK
jgi:hypothetical protein